MLKITQPSVRIYNIYKIYSIYRKHSKISNKKINQSIKFCKKKKLQGYGSNNHLIIFFIFYPPNIHSLESLKFNIILPKM